MSKAWKTGKANGEQNERQHAPKEPNTIVPLRVSPSRSATIARRMVTSLENVLSRRR